MENDKDRLATYDFQSVICGNYEPIVYRFQDKRRFRLKFKHFSTSAHLMPTQGSLWNFAVAVGLKNGG